MKDRQTTYLGRSMIRAGMAQKLSGTAVYTHDLKMDGMLYGATVYAGVPRGELVSIDFTEAAATEGVVAVVTAADIVGENQIGAVKTDQPLLVEKHVRWRYDRVALVVAATLRVASEAARKVRATIIPKEPLFDIRKAESPLADRLHEQYPDNVAARLRLVKGDCTAAMNHAVDIYEETFETGYQEHVPLEPQGSLAFWEESTLTIRGSMQCPYSVRQGLSRMLKLPENQVRVIVQTVGGGFGGKQDYPTEIAGCAALCATVTKKPVLFLFDREQEIAVSPKRHPSITRFRMGFDANGDIAAEDIKVRLDAGPYAQMSPIVLWRNCNVNTGPYRVKHVNIDARAIYTNNLSTSAFRGFGHVQALFAHESMMDLTAKEKGIDPWEFRKRHLLQRGESNAAGDIMEEDYRLPQCLDLLEQKIERQMLRRQINEFNTQSFHVKRGLGLSLMQFGCNLGAVDKELDHACATVTINPDQTVEIMTGLVEMGQGALTVLSQIGAEALGVPYRWMRPSLPDTSRIGDSGPSAASRVTMMGGQAVIKTATELKKRLTSAAASIAGTESEAISICDGRIMAGSAELVWQEVYDKARESGELSCSARFDNADQYGPWDQTVCQGNAYVAYTHAAQAALVQVDVQTGQTSVIWVKSVYDIGTVINPALARAQVEGGVVMGLGYALSEDLCALDGDCCVKNLSDYVIPTTLDCPQTIETWFLNEPCSKGPFGAKSLGEPAFVPTIAAVIGAIHDAAGVRVRRCPATPQRLLSAILEKSSGKAQAIHAKT